MSNIVDEIASSLDSLNQDITDAENEIISKGGTVESHGSSKLASNISSIPTGGGGTSDYNGLVNKPKIGEVTLEGNKSLSDLGISPQSHSHTKSDITDFPTNVSDFTNDSGYVTANDLIELVNTLRGIDSVESEINKVRGV